VRREAPDWRHQREDEEPVRYQQDPLGEILDAAAGAALTLGALITILALAYVAYGIFSAFPGGQIPAEPSFRAAVTARFALGLRALVWGVGILVLAAGWKFRLETAAGYLLAVTGAALLWGMPAVVPHLFPAGYGEGAALTADAARRCGAMCAGVGAALLVFHLVSRVGDVLSGRRSRLVDVPHDPDWIPRPGAVPLRCWQTGFCRPYVRSFCPRYQEKTPCWRRKEGCFCEERIVLRAREMRQGASEFYAQMRSSLSGPVTSLSPAQKRERCRSCPIYGEHQRFKYRLSVPFAFVAASGILWFGADGIRRALLFSVEKLDAVASSLAFRAPQAAGEAGAMAAAAQEAIGNSIVFWGFMVFLFVMTLTWLLRLVEWLFLKVQV
jgi:hypothetical protein